MKAEIKKVDVINQLSRLTTLTGGQLWRKSLDVLIELLEAIKDYQKELSNGI
jgi:hypothetical protein